MGVWAAAAVAGVAMLSSMQQSKQKEDTMDFNAAVAASDAAQNRAFAAADADRHRQDAKRAMGRSRAQAGATGVDVGTGSTIDVLADDALQFELDALNIAAKGDSAARANEMQAASARMQARQTKSAAPLSALGAGMSGFAAGTQMTSSFNKTTKTT